MTLGNWNWITIILSNFNASRDMNSLYCLVYLSQTFRVWFSQCFKAHHLMMFCFHQDCRGAKGQKQRHGWLRRCPLVRDTLCGDLYQALVSANSGPWHPCYCLECLNPSYMLKLQSDITFIILRGQKSVSYSKVVAVRSLQRKWIIFAILESGLPLQASRISQCVGWKISKAAPST